MKPFYTILISFHLILLLTLTGCSDKIKLSGKVTYPDGEPLKTGTIMFSKPDFLARAHIKADGSYDVGSLSAKDGLPPGKYKVFITGAIESVSVTEKPSVPQKNTMGEQEQEKESFKALIAAQYAAEETTPLEIEIPGKNVYNITVERP
ncbi:MAG: carboxypeptidase-like regulatory domain-containing protein [Planctomycetaceae bacterium]|nr:carboxypeptidase-like regulatory domain-containing protein [Planctomycetaceae bacterium]